MPVIASGDIVDRESASRVLEQTGAAAVMVGRGAQGKPWALREIAGGESWEPNRAEVIAELVRFMREVEREMGRPLGWVPAQVLRLVPARGRRRQGSCGPR